MTLFGYSTPTLYLLLVGAVALARLGELVVAGRNARRLLRDGAVEAGADDYRWMVRMHAAFLVACPLEVFLLDRPWIPSLAVAMTALLIGSLALRYWVIATLGPRWCTRVIYPPGAPRVTSGPYRFLRHPNYAAVVLELLALPLIHSAWLSAIVFGALNAWVLYRRIRVEEDTLARLADRPSGQDATKGKGTTATPGARRNGWTGEEA